MQFIDRNSAMCRRTWTLSFALTLAISSVGCAATTSSAPKTTPKTATTSATPKVDDATKPKIAASSNVNLLTNNAGFETPGNFGGGHGITTAIPGWEAEGFAYDGFGVTSGDVAKGEVDEGKRMLNLNHGARITTAAADRVDVKPGTLYRMGFDAAKPVENFLGAWAGIVPTIQFFDASGKLLQSRDEMDVAMGAASKWTHYTLDRIAPEGAVKAGVQAQMGRGGWPNEDKRVGWVDNFSLVAVPETTDSVIVRRAPELLEAGKTANLVVKYTAMQPRDIVVRLMNDTKTVGQAKKSVVAGRGLAEISYRVLDNLPLGDKYQWRIEILPRGGALTTALKVKLVSGVFNDTKMTGDGVIAADNPNLLLAGRWDKTDPKNPIMYWGGSQIYTRFAGTSVKVRIKTANGERFLAVIDGDLDKSVKFVIQDNAATIATGLPNGIHSLMIMKNGEANAPAIFQGLELDKGKGTLRPEPLPKHRIEFYGDSITSGGMPEPLKPNPDENKDGDYTENFNNTYAGFTSRALDADWRPISKGGSGIAGSFSFSYTLMDYWNRLDMDAYNPQKSRVYDFAQWQPEVVVIAIGHNDQFRKPSQEVFDKNYAQLITNLHQVYPKAHIFVTNTSMSSDWQWKSAIQPLLKNDPKLHFQMFNPTQTHAGHPRLKDHREMALGNMQWQSLAEWIGNTMGW